MYFVYILYSPVHDKTYVGQTMDLEQRLHRHNHTNYNTFTSKFRPWQLMHSEKYATRAEAMRREKWYKTGAGRDRIRKIKSKFLSGS